MNIVHKYYKHYKLADLKNLNEVLILKDYV